jgi:hypothetical protein
VIPAGVGLHDARSEGSHRSVARRLVAVGWCPILAEDYYLRCFTGGYGEPGTRPVISADKAAAHNAAPPTKIKSQSKMLMARHFVPSQRSAYTKFTRFGFLLRASPRAWIAWASASPLKRIA